MPSKIGRFEIQAEIWRSSTGSVSKACDPTGGQIVALKTVDLKPFGEKAPALVKRILEEAEGSKLLNTHNIAMLFGAGEIDGQFCATMEYVQGNSIETMLARKEVFSIWDVQDIARQTCQGLDHARVNKVLHYSLEPAKVMVQWDGIVKMLGFGVSMMGVFAAEICSDIPKILHYMSPEQLQGAPLDASSNLFSLGAILYEMVTQRKAFGGEDADHVRQSVLEFTPVAPGEINSKIDPALSDIIMKVLSKAPEQRYQSGQELINDLEKCKNNPIKSPAANKTVQLPAAFKAPQINKPSAMCASPSEKSFAAKIAPSAPVASTAQPLTATAQAKGQQIATGQPAETKASAAAAGAGTTKPNAPTLQSLRAAKLDSSPQFITTCIKASIDAATLPAPKMSVAAAEPEVNAPKIAIDPMMDESRQDRNKQVRSFSEIDELPPLKTAHVAPQPPPVAVEYVPEDGQFLPALGNSEADKESLPAREMAQKAIAEIKNTPPKMFAYSIGVAIAIILSIGAIIMFRVRSDNGDDEGTPATTSVVSPASRSDPSGLAINGTGQNAAPVQSSPEVPAASLPEETAGSQISVKARYGTRKKSKSIASAPVIPLLVPAQLMVNSNPEGAQVQVDAHTDPNWITPYNIAGLSPGQHTVYINKAGYAPEIRTIEAISGGKSTVTISFRQLPATIFFVSAPVGAAIIVDGKDSGQVTPAQISLDKSGPHIFLLKKQGYLEETTSANLAPGQTFHYSPTLVPLGNTDDIKTVGKLKKMFGSTDPAGMGIVSVKIQPKGAQIAVNGRLLEKSSPVDFYLNPGTYIVDVTLTGHKSARHIIAVNRGGKINLDDILDPQ